MRHVTTIKWMLMAGLMCSPLLANAQLLKGKLVGIQGEDVAVAYSPDGYLLNQQVIEVQVAEDGTFTYDRPLEKSADVEIYVGEAGIFGAHLENGKTLEMTITKNGKEMDATFKGPNAEISRFVNLSSKAFDSMKYSSMDPSASRPNAEYRALLEENYAKVKAALKKIKNKEQRQYYTRLSEGNYKWTKARLIMDDCENKKVNSKTDPEMLALIKDIDVNDDINYQTNMSLTALNQSAKNEFGGNNEALCYELMDIVNKRVTNPKLRNVMVRIIGQDYYIYGDGTGNYEEFTKRFKEFAGQDAPIVDGMYKQFLEVKKSKEKTAAGTTAPDITLDTPDGKQVQLKDVCKGKFTYIDVWATWCGPCKKEIPHMAKLVERFKGNDKVQFLSISVDESVEAWKKMIEADKPAWAQYNIHGAVNAQFSKDWGITGIPRFIMIDKDGNIFAADASRPSNEETAKTIEEQTK
ncbi:MAG: TlpA family protein disulfide reductase [Prevotella sp.]|nr:TlpA family protein disulfide reductase [Prevotella sp.]MBQ7716336.1 TlpA family protein disulfide reductase [Prevotella sp.]MBQ9570613.1 TlpA family protein disulfide reductase [Prevotella sp.]